MEEKIKYFESWLNLKLEAAQVYGEDDEIYAIEEIYEKFEEVFNDV